MRLEDVRRLRDPAVNAADPAFLGKARGRVQKCDRRSIGRGQPSIAMVDADGVRKQTAGWSWCWSVEGLKCYFLNLIDQRTAFGMSTHRPFLCTMKFVSFVH
jgi:hypothetical protein